MRIEAFVYYLALAGAKLELLESINGCKTSEEAVKLIMETGNEEIFDTMTKGCEERIRRYLKKNSPDIKVMMYSMDYGILGGNDD